MKKLLLFLSIFLCFFPFLSTNFTQAESSNGIYVVVSNSAVVYEEPNLSSEKLKTLKHNQEISLLLFEDSPQTFLSYNYTFFKVLGYEDIDGYILADLVVPKTEMLTAIPNFSAKLNRACKVYFLEDTVLTESEITLNKNQQIFLYEGFKNKEEFNAVAFVYDNQVLYGYIETKWISPNGVNPLIITCITVIIAALGIVFAWVFIKTKKVKIKKSLPKTQKK